MDLLGFALMLYVCCLGIGIPAIVTSSTYALVSFLPEEKRLNALKGSSFKFVLIAIFVIIFILSCALLLYSTQNNYMM